MKNLAEKYIEAYHESESRGPIAEFAAAVSVKLSVQDQQAFLEHIADDYDAHDALMTELEAGQA